MDISSLIDSEEPPTRGLRTSQQYASTPRSTSYPDQRFPHQSKNNTIQQGLPRSQSPPPLPASVANDQFSRQSTGHPSSPRDEHRQYHTSPYTHSRPASEQPPQTYTPTSVGFGPPTAISHNSTGSSPTSANNSQQYWPRPTSPHSISDTNSMQHVASPHQHHNHPISDLSKTRQQAFASGYRGGLQSPIAVQRRDHEIRPEPLGPPLHRGTFLDSPQRHDQLRMQHDLPPPSNHINGHVVDVRMTGETRNETARQAFRTSYGDTSEGHSTSHQENVLSYDSRGVSSPNNPRVTRRSDSMGIGGLLNSEPTRVVSERDVSEVAVNQAHSQVKEQPNNLTDVRTISSTHTNETRAPLTKVSVEHAKEDAITTHNNGTMLKDPEDSTGPAKKRVKRGSVNGHISENDTPIETPVRRTSTGVAKSTKPPRLPMPVFAQSVRKVGMTIESMRSSAVAAEARGSPGSFPIPQTAIGVWEPTITNLIPTDEIVKVVSDFLYIQLMENPTIGVAPAGATSTSGAILEIEAKIGRLIDKDTNDRIRMPVRTETVFDRNNPSIRTKFETSVTQHQYRTLNSFLNETLKSTQILKPTPQNPRPAANNRVRMSYKHSRETDVFFGLTQKGLLALPDIARGRSGSGMKPTVRVTRDYATGKELARIVKTRLADLDIYSPQNVVDWRVSVNVEMHFDGDTSDLVEPTSHTGKALERNKDRLSYKHQAYQVDMTAVTTIEANSKDLKPPDYELEVEVSSEEMRRQADLLTKGEPNRYADLIAGLVGNMRILAREIPFSPAPPDIS